MKKVFLLCFNILVITSLWAQKPSLTKAYNHFYDKEYDKAKSQIDLCISDEKLSGKAQTWLYKGNIEFLLANREYSEKQKNENYVIRYPNAPEEAFDAFEKSFAINPKAEALDMLTANEALGQLYPYLYVQGFEYLLVNDFQKAEKTLSKAIKSYEFGSKQYPLNGDLYYYYAFSLENLGDTVKMIDYYKKAIEDGSKNAYAFAKLAEFYKNQGNKKEIYKILEDAKSKNPNDVSIKMLEIDVAYWDNDSVKASRLLKQIDLKSIKTADELVNVSNFYIKEKNYDEAISLLERAKNLSPENFVIIYNLGVCNYSMSEKWFAEQNKMQLASNNAKAQEMKETAEMYLERSAEYFEKARKMQPEDMGLLTTLRAIYYRMYGEKSSKYEEIDKIIKKNENK